MWELRQRSTHLTVAEDDDAVSSAHGVARLTMLSGRSIVRAHDTLSRLVTQLLLSRLLSSSPPAPVTGDCLRFPRSSYLRPPVPVLSQSFLLRPSWRRPCLSDWKTFVPPVENMQ